MQLLVGGIIRDIHFEKKVTILSSQNVVFYNCVFDDELILKSENLKTSVWGDDYSAGIP